MIGYDNLPSNAQLLLDLQFREWSGLLALDHSKAHHAMVLHGTPTWTQRANDLNYLDFDSAHPDFLDCSAVASADLDFTAGAFTLACWVAYGGVGSRYLMARGRIDTDGWEWYVNASSEIGRAHV